MAADHGRYRLLGALGVLLAASCPAAGQSGILIDQFGYRPGDPKLAFVREFQKGPFEVVSAADSTTAFKGTIRAIGTTDEATGDIVFELDFGALRTPGTYRCILPDRGITSGEFRIAEDVYSAPFISAAESFFYQRCGTALSNGTPWQHAECHQKDAVFYADPSRQKAVTGGWHDAGDYGKFVATGTLSAAFLLYLYERQSGKFTDRQLNIPESGNGVPDLLDEVRWELQWLLKMQGEDGGVYHKVSTKKWTGEYLPQKDPDQRYIFAVSSSATGSFAAVTALAARVFERWDKRFAQELLRASVTAWKFLEDHRAVLPPGGFRNPPGVEGGEYGDQQDADERLWASVELYRTSGSEQYQRYFLANYQQIGGIASPLSWVQVQNFAYYSYLKLPASRSDVRARSFILGTLTAYCDRLLRRVQASGYRHVLASDEFYWGSNSVCAGYAFDLLEAYEATRGARYLNAALDQLHYFLGRNTFGISFLTGVGTNPVRHPYHQFSMKLGAPEPVPGLLVGGPNRGNRLRGAVLSEFPGRCYEDNEKNYYVNEVAINYTAPFVYLAGSLTELMVPDAAGGKQLK